MINYKSKDRNKILIKKLGILKRAFIKGRGYKLINPFNVNGNFFVKMNYRFTEKKLY